MKSSLPLLALCLALAACGGPREVTVRVTIPGPDSVETPVPEVTLVALPYDRDSLLRSMEAAAGAPPAAARAALDTLFADFRGPFTAFARTSFALSALRDSVAATRKELDALPAGAPDRAALDERLVRLEAARAAAEQARATAQQELDRARTAFAVRGDSLRGVVRGWESKAFEGYDSVTAGLARAAGRDPVADTTDARGLAQFRLPAGRWWIHARSWDATDPNAEWYWNVPLPAEGDTLELTGATAQRRPRY